MVEILEIKIPATIRISSKKVMDYVKKDKKVNSASTIKLILLKEHGQHFIKETKISDIEKTLKKVKVSWKPKV